MSCLRRFCIDARRSAPRTPLLSGPARCGVSPGRTDRALLPEPARVAAAALSLSLLFLRVAPASADLLTRSFAMKEALGMKAELANTALNLCVVHHLQRNFELARDYYERALSIGEQTGNRRSIATGLTNLGNLLMEEGRPADAEVVLRRALAETEAQGDQTRDRKSVV